MTENRDGQAAAEQSRSPSAETADLSPDALLDVVLSEQRHDWLDRKRVSAAERLGLYPTLAAHPASAAEVIYHEFMLRQEAGECPKWDNYLRLFPRYARQLSALRLADELAGEIGEDPARAGLQIGDYVILDEIGRGGMGIVYRALQRSLRRVVALKMLPAGQLTDPVALDRFVKEALAVSKLNHPNIVQIYSIDETPRHPFIAYEFVDGLNLAKRIGGTALEPQLAASIVAAVARAIQYANDHGIIHRDLKPANVLLSETAQGLVPKVTDFGACKTIEEHNSQQKTQVVGTPAYMAPEQLHATKRRIRNQTDVYGLGTSLYECLTGVAPFRGETVGEVLRQVADEMPLAPHLVNPSAPRDLETICVKCLAKDPSQRYESAGHVADELERFMQALPIIARPPGPARRIGMWCRRKPGMAGLMAILLLALSAGVTGITAQWLKAEAARKDALASDAESRELLREMVQWLPTMPALGYGPVAPTIDSLRAAETHCKNLLAKNPNDIALRIALTKVYGNLGTLSAQRGQLPESEASFNEARGVWQSLATEVAGDPVCRDWLATTYCWVNLDDIRHWFQLRERANAIWEQLAEEQPDNLEFTRKIWETRLAIANSVSSVHREDCLRLLDDKRIELERLVCQNAADRVLRRRLALTCFQLGEIFGQIPVPEKARSAWQESFEHYNTLTDGRQDDLLCTISLATCCSRLIQGGSADPYYVRAVSLLEKASKRLGALSMEHPQHWLQELLLDNYCCLVFCHVKAGQAAKAQFVSNDRISSVTPPLLAERVDPQFALQHTTTLLKAGQLLRDGRQRAAALRLARQAGELCSQLAVFPPQDPMFLYQLGFAAVNSSALANQLGDSALALSQAELGRRIIEKWVSKTPDRNRHGHELGNAWERIAKARWSLGRRDQALAAFRESAAQEKRAFEQVPSNRSQRLWLTRSYEKLAYYSSISGDLRAAALAIRNREKLWHDDAEQLVKAAGEFDVLANRVAAGSHGPLSRDDKAERDKYIAESRRLREAAKAAIRQSNQDVVGKR